MHVYRSIVINSPKPSGNITSKLYLPKIPPTSKSVDMSPAALGSKCAGERIHMKT